MFPLVAALEGRRVVVVGAGRVGARKATQLRAAGARVTVVASEVLAPLPEGVDLVARPYRAGDLAGAALCVSATGDAAVDDLIVAEARDRRVWLNVVDDPVRSTFFFTAVHRAGDVVVSVSTEGAAPALAQWVRDLVARVLPANLGDVARHLRAERRDLHVAGESTEGRDWRARVVALVEDARAAQPGA